MMIIAILSDQSLLMQGIISHLHRSAPTLNIHVTEIGESDVIEKWITLAPDVVILDSKELCDPSLFPLNRLFAGLPHVVVMKVNIETSDIQIIRSDQYTASGVSDFINIFKSASVIIPGSYSSIEPLDKLRL
jgi:chemotaxis response regulator CheB